MHRLSTSWQMWISGANVKIQATNGRPVSVPRIAALSTRIAESGVRIILSQRFIRTPDSAIRVDSAAIRGTDTGRPFVACILTLAPEIHICQLVESLCIYLG